MFGRRVKAPGGARMPVIVVTGFLGAGKTTLIRAVLESERGARTAIIVNEFGEIGIDHALLRPGSEATILLGNGCLCCRMSSDLRETCLGLLRDRARGTVPSFERIVVETSGIADPIPILQTFLAERGLRDDFHLRGLIAVVDAATFERTVLNVPECLGQVRLADRIIVTKTDLIDAEAAARVRSTLREINPAADVAVATDGRVAPGFVVDLDAVAKPFSSIAGTRHATGVTTFSVVIDTRVQWEAFSRALRMLMSLRGPDLLRVKGIVNVQGCVGPVVIHLVQHLAHPPVELQAWPTDDRRSRVVFIVRNMTETTVRNVIVAVQDALAESKAPA
jgi:G3E family GTPase